MGVVDEGLVQGVGPVVDEVGDYLVLVSGT